MRKRISSLQLLVIAMFPCFGSVALADEPAIKNHLSADTLAIYDPLPPLLANEREYAVRNALDAANFSYAPQRARYRVLADLPFQNNNLMARIAGLRELTRFTVASTDSTRWYLGVNDAGFVGLHFGLVE